MAHVNFLQHIEGGYHYLYQTAERIYLGSVIASFLETGVDLESKIDDNIIYYLDTQIVFRSIRFTEGRRHITNSRIIKAYKSNRR